MVQGRAEARNLRLDMFMAPQLPGFVVGDPVRLRQIMVNFLGNAVKFTTQGYIRLEMTMPAPDAGGERLRIAVRDTGVGIDPAFAPVLFEKFRQADASTTRRYGGRRLGLAIALLSTRGPDGCQMPEMDGYTAATRNSPGGRWAQPHENHCRDRKSKWKATARSASMRGWTTICPKRSSGRSCRRFWRESSRTLRKPHLLIQPSPAEAQPQQELR
ncbi:MAG TPA: ATP-binding protein, partial [Bryobacteraceae bacterium]|nr:ATP-binding protein [Bryobacteraceae bacterium]